VVTAEGSDYRLLFVGDGGILGTHRAPRSHVVAASERMFAGQSQPAIGSDLDGQARVQVEWTSGGPRLERVASVFDVRPTSPRCAPGNSCRFTTPRGTTTLAFGNTFEDDAKTRAVEIY
jgi:hypothetical protein